MATGHRVSGWRAAFGLLACLLFAATPLAAQEVGLAGIMGSRAMLIINGGQPEAVRVGETLDGVKVVSIQGEQVIVEIGGRKRPLRIGQQASGSASTDGSGKIVLAADANGHFFTTGTVNGATIRFMVDTGASTIALGISDARRIGLDLNSGERAYTQTANGTVEVRRVKLDTVTIAGVTLHYVEASVLPTDQPIALLGMSFLNRMEMHRDGSTMTLRQRY
ncbi:MAG: TIGR02281 family clan AA aspartic protease [Desulfobulbus sp.]|nr:TIGR02281 family clan AA aspartic protease [Desulfobulbus sp.]